jgi:hypothetical protein
MVSISHRSLGLLRRKVSDLFCRHRRTFEPEAIDLYKDHLSMEELRGRSPHAQRGQNDSIFLPRFGLMARRVQNKFWARSSSANLPRWRSVPPSL